jgi:prepilin-type N-terminal cleavage/methylation domain-containing protein
MYGKFLKMMKKNRKGFTLVELMVVVVILGILVAIAVPVYNSSTQKAQDNANKATARTILGAIQVASANNETNNPSETQINACLNNPKITISATASDTAPWTVNYSSNAWHVYHWDGSASVEITVP